MALQCYKTHRSTIIRDAIQTMHHKGRPVQPLIITNQIPDASDNNTSAKSVPIYQTLTKDADANNKAAYTALHPSVISLVDEFSDVFQPLSDELPPRRDSDHRMDREKMNLPSHLFNLFINFPTKRTKRFARN